METNVHSENGVHTETQQPPSGDFLKKGDKDEENNSGLQVQRLQTPSEMPTNSKDDVAKESGWEEERKKLLAALRSEQALRKQAKTDLMTKEKEHQEQVDSLSQNLHDRMSFLENQVLEREAQILERETQLQEMDEQFIQKEADMRSQLAAKDATIKEFQESIQDLQEYCSSQITDLEDQVHLRINNIDELEARLHVLKKHSLDKMTLDELKVHKTKVKMMIKKKKEEEEEKRKKERGRTSFLSSVWKFFRRCLTAQCPEL